MSNEMHETRFVGTRDLLSLQGREVERSSLR